MKREWTRWFLSYYIYIVLESFSCERQKWTEVQSLFPFKPVHHPSVPAVRDMPVTCTGHSSSGSWIGTVILRWVHCVTHPGQYIEMCSSLLKPTLLGCLISLSVTYTGLKTSEVHESVPGHYYSQVIRVGTQHWLYGEQHVAFCFETDQGSPDFTYFGRLNAKKALLQYLFLCFE